MFFFFRFCFVGLCFVFVFACFVVDCFFVLRSRRQHAYKLYTVCVFGSIFTVVNFSRESARTIHYLPGHSGAMCLLLLECV